MVMGMVVVRLREDFNRILKVLSRYVISTSTEL